MLPGRRTPNGALFGSNTLPPPGTPLVGGIAVSQAGVIYMDGLSSAWDPAQLFVNGEMGIWYDISDITSLFQDAGGTVPVTASGQLVGRINDKSGNGINATIGPAKRPVYETDGTHHYLKFDGVDDTLNTVNINFSTTNEITAFAGVRKLNDPSFGIIMETSIGSNTNLGSFNLGATSGWITSVNGTEVAAVSSAADPAPVSTVLTMISTISGDSLRLRNRGIQTESLDPQGTGNFGNYPLYIGERGGSTFPFMGNMYQLIVLGRMASPTEIDDTEVYIGHKSGVTIA